MTTITSAKCFDEAKLDADSNSYSFKKFHIQEFKTQNVFCALSITVQITFLIRQQAFDNKIIQTKIANRRKP